MSCSVHPKTTALCRTPLVLALCPDACLSVATAAAAAAAVAAIAANALNILSLVTVGPNSGHNIAIMNFSVEGVLYYERDTKFSEPNVLVEGALYYERDIRA